MANRVLLFLIIGCCSVEINLAQAFKVPDTISLQSANLTLKGLLWRPVGKGPFATVVFTLGSYPNSDTVHNPIKDASILGPIFASEGYIYLALFRRGVGLSKDQGLNSADLMENAFEQHGQDGRNAVQLKQLETDQLQDMIAGLAWLRKRPEVDLQRMAIIGHSFGGSLALLVAEQDPNIKTVVLFGPAAASWDNSPPLRFRLIHALENISAPVLIIHAKNDYSLKPGYELDSVRHQRGRQHQLIIYPKFRNSSSEGHNMIFQNTKVWEADVFKFLKTNLRN